MAALRFGPSAQLLAFEAVVKFAETHREPLHPNARTVAAGRFLQRDQERESRAAAIVHTRTIHPDIARGSDGTQRFVPTRGHRPIIEPAGQTQYGLFFAALHPQDGLRCAIRRH